MAIPQDTPPVDRESLLWTQDENIARMFAASAAFQDEVGENDVSETLNKHVFDWKAVEPGATDFEKCRVLIEMGVMNRALSGDWSTTGEVPVMIERKQNAFDETNEGYRTSKAEFMRLVSKVLTQVEKRSKEVSEQILGFNPLRFNAYNLVEGPHLVPASEVTQSDVKVAQADRKVIWWIEFSFQVN